MRIVRVLACMGVLIGSTSVSRIAEAAAAPVTTSGYVRMTDGVLLRYTLTRPSAHGRFPVLINYGPYDSGEGTYFYWYPVSRLALRDGFAILGLNMRGTGCSSGAWSVFDPHLGTDGAAAVESIARQSWSNGHVGMFGASFEGISEVMVAQHRPEHLDAIAPGQILTDAYRDLGYPGGILNAGFGALYPAEQADASYGVTPGAVAGGDVMCAINNVEHRTLAQDGVQALGSPYTDSPLANYTSVFGDDIARKIAVPVFTTRTWQDTQTGPRNSYFLDDLDRARTWSIESNGNHAELYDYQPMIAGSIEQFFAHFVKGVDNGFERTPHERLYHEVDANLNPAWISSLATWHPPTTPLSLYLSPDGALLRAKPRPSGGSQSYVYPMPAPTAPDEDQYYGYTQTNAPVTIAWATPPAPAGYLAYTTPRLTRDAEIFGSGNADLWVSSTAVDTDLQITLTEVRPDGQEVYLQRGWLRASHRKEDPHKSTLLRPFQTHKQSDVQLLTPGTPTHMRVELFPVDHVFRKGSSIRLIIDAPTGMIGDWALGYLNTPAVNTIWSDASHPSRFVLPLIDGSAHAPMPKCGTVLSEICRTSIAPVPAGALRP